MQRGRAPSVTPLVFVSTILILALYIPSTYCIEYQIVYSYPQPIYPDSDITLTFEIRNLGTKPLRISRVEVSFDWSGASYPVDGPPTVIQSGGSAAFRKSVHVPDGISTNTDHAVTITMFAADPALLGGWGKDDQLQTRFSMFISKPPPPPNPQTIAIDRPQNRTPDYGGFIGALPWLALMTLIALAFVAVVMRQHSRVVSHVPARELAPKHSATQPQEISTTVAYCRNCGTPLKADSNFCEQCGERLRGEA
jgi:hypothetical protein